MNNTLRRQWIEGARRVTGGSPALARKHPVHCGRLKWTIHGQRRHQTWKAPSADDPVLVEIVRRLADVYRPERIYLFGSTARGEAGPDSDYDLLIVVSDDAPADKKDSDLGYTAVEGLPRSGDFLVWTRHLFESRLHLKASLPSTVMREGKLLYAA